MPRYRLYGVTIDSEFELHAPRATTDAARIRVAWGGERPVPTTYPEGEVLSSVQLGAFNYSTTRTADGYVVRFPNVCDAEVSEDLSTVRLIVPSAEQKEVARLLFIGGVMTMILTLGGGCVLHGSAVEMDGDAIGFIGAPGAGKSTMAAMACAVGARLITDDVLRVVPRPEGWRCPTGSTQLRLREAASTLVPLLEGTVDETLDSRTGVSLPLPDAEWPLKALVFPAPSRTTDALDMTRLGEHDALMRLTSFPRVLGWRDPRVLAQTFRWNARLAREVPCYTAVVPWGPPFDPDIATTLAASL